MVNEKISRKAHAIVRLAAILGFVILIGCVSKELSEKVISEENIGGKYNAKLVTSEMPIQYESFRKTAGKDYIEFIEIQYSIGDKKFRGNYPQETYFIDSIDWIKRNTSENSIFLNWWDYGHMIRGATGRDVVIAQPSKELALKTISMIGKIMDEKTFEEKYGYEVPEKIKDVGVALTTDDINVTNKIMDKYNAKYIYTTMFDLDVIHTMKEEDFETIVDTPQGQKTVPSKRFYESTLAKLQLFKGKDLKNYRLVYESQPNLKSNEKHYKNVYNILYGGNLTSEDSGYIKIFEYVKN
jgi:asparagine N-glycosylation enzyme membrane subunit Stt3